MYIYICIYKSYPSMNGSWIFSPPSAAARPAAPRARPSSPDLVISTFYLHDTINIPPIHDQHTMTYHDYMYLREIILTQICTYQHT